MVGARRDANDHTKNAHHCANPDAQKFKAPNSISLLSRSTSICRHHLIALSSRGSSAPCSGITRHYKVASKIKKAIAVQEKDDAMVFATLSYNIFAATTTTHAINIRKAARAMTSSITPTSNLPHHPHVQPGQVALRQAALSGIHRRKLQDSVTREGPTTRALCLIDTRVGQVSTRLGLQRSPHPRGETLCSTWCRWERLLGQRRHNVHGVLEAKFPPCFRISGFDMYTSEVRPDIWLADYHTAAGALHRVQVLLEPLDRRLQPLKVLDHLPHPLQLLLGYSDSATVDFPHSSWWLRAFTVSSSP